MSLLSEDELPDFLLGSLPSAAVEWTETDVRRAVRAMLELANAGVMHLPLFLALDLDAVLRGGYDTPFAWESLPEEWSPERRALHLRYEKRFLFPMLQEPDVASVLEHIRCVTEPEPLRARLLQLLLLRFAPMFPDEVQVNPAHLRRQVHGLDLGLDPYQARAEFERGPGRATWFESALTRFLDRLASRMRWSELLSEEDRFELDHWEALHREELRLGCRQIIRVAQQLGAFDLRSLPAPPEEADADTVLEDDSPYPTGGFSEITNHGSFENLVLTELAYIEESGDVDLFDVRFVENELLFYQRDSGQLRRRRRRIHFVLALGALWQAKSTGYPVRYATLVQALVLRMARDLFAVFEDDAVEVHIHFVEGEDAEESDLTPVHNLMEVLLKAEIEHGWVTLHRCGAIRSDQFRATTHQVVVQVFCRDCDQAWPGFDPRPLKESRLCVSHVRVGGDDDSESRMCLPQRGLGSGELKRRKTEWVQRLMLAKPIPTD